MFITSHMGLTAWDLGEDFFEGSDMANNWKAIDQHDHTLGKGQQIPSSGLRDGAVTESKLADNSVTPAKIPNGSLTGAEIAPDTIDGSHLKPNSVGGSELQDGAVGSSKIDPNFLPVGSVIAWYRPNGSISPPTGWEVCDGRNWSGISNSWGVTTGTIPDLRNRFILGAALSGIGSSPADPPDIGQVGGSQTRDFAHVHAVNAHSHTVNSHTHSIVTDGAHRHRFEAEQWDANGHPTGVPGLVDGHQRGTAVPGAAGVRQSFYIPGVNVGQFYGEDVAAPMETVVGHDHSGATGGATAATNSVAGATGNALADDMDMRPQFVGLLYIMKVRN